MSYHWTSRPTLALTLLASLSLATPAGAASVNTYGALDGDDGGITPYGKSIFEVRHITTFNSGIATPQVLMGVSFGTFKRAEWALTWATNPPGSGLTTFPGVWPWFKYAVWMDGDEQRPWDLNLSLLWGAAIPTARSTVAGSLGFMGVLARHFGDLFLALNLGYAANAAVDVAGMPSEHLLYGNLTWTYDISEPWQFYGEVFGHYLTVSPANGGGNLGLMWRPRPGVSLDMTVGPTFSSGTTVINFGTGVSFTL